MLKFSLSSAVWVGLSYVTPHCCVSSVLTPTCKLSGRKLFLEAALSSSRGALWTCTLTERWSVSAVPRTAESPHSHIQPLEVWQPLSPAGGSRLLQLQAGQAGEEPAEGGKLQRFTVEHNVYTIRLNWVKSELQPQVLFNQVIKKISIPLWLLEWNILHTPQQLQFLILHSNIRS